MRIKDIMFSLLGSEINMAQLNADIHKNFTHETYEELYALSTKHDLSHIVASALSRRGLLGNDDISVKFNKQLMMAVYRDSQKEYALDQLGTLLENAKIPHIMLKGAIIRKFYPQSWMRTSCDVDVLVQKQDTECIGIEKSAKW